MKRTYSPSLVRLPVLELLLMVAMEELVLTGSEGDMFPVSPMLLTRLVSLFFSLRPKLMAKDSAPLCEKSGDDLCKWWNAFVCTGDHGNDVQGTSVAHLFKLASFTC